MSPLILLLFTTEYCNIMMNSTCSVVYLSPLHTSFMQVFLASRHCYQFSWTGHQRVKRNSFTRKGKVLIHFQAWKRSESLSSSFYQRTEYFFLERNSTFSENTPSKNEILKKKAFQKIHFRKIGKIHFQSSWSLWKVHIKQARKSSEDAQAAGYAQFEKVWAG